MNYLVSVIVPIYGVEKYIEKCVVSLFDQDFESIEYIFVNDCTPDNSMNVLKTVIEHYPQRGQHIKIIEHDNNKGLGAARKTGIINATGEYTIHIDSDDWCELDMISSLYRKAKEDSADIVIANLFKNFADHQIEVRQPFVKDFVLAGIISGELDNSCANKLVKRRLYIDNSIYPPEHISMAEDRYLIIRLACMARIFSFIDRAFLHYRQDNNQSLTFGYSRKSFEDFKVFLIETSDFLRKRQLFDVHHDAFSKMLVMHIHQFIFYEELDFLKENYYQSLKIKYIWKFQGSRTVLKLIKSIMLISPNFLSKILSKVYYFFRRR